MYIMRAPVRRCRGRCGTLANQLVGSLHGRLRHQTVYNEHTAWSHRLNRAARQLTTGMRIVRRLPPGSLPSIAAPLSKVVMVTEILAAVGSFRLPPTVDQRTKPMGVRTLATTNSTGPANTRFTCRCPCRALGLSGIRPSRIRRLWSADLPPVDWLETGAVLLKFGGDRRPCPFVVQSCPLVDGDAEHVGLLVFMKVLCDLGASAVAGRPVSIAHRGRRSCSQSVVRSWTATALSSAVV